jgi:hypothetical protein
MLVGIWTTIFNRTKHRADRHHKSCIELCTYDYELLERSNVQWLSCKCESINVSTFTCQSYELETSNIYQHLSNLNESLDSIRSVFSSIKTSSPGFSQSPHGYILVFLFGPGLVSISPANMMTMSRMLVVFFAFDGKHSGLEPELCILVIKWNCRGICCDDCSIWHHKSCIEPCTYERSNVQWLSCKWESINVSTFSI